MDYARGFLGIIVLLSVAWVLSGNKKQVNWRLVAIGVTLQITFGLLVMQVPFVTKIFNAVSEGFVVFLGFTNDGTRFLFGNLVDNPSIGFVFALKVLPTIIFFSTISAGLYYLGILQKIVYGIAWVMARTMHLSGAESLSAAGNIFLGQTEAPLLVKPFVANMTKSELLCLMTGGMATIAGGVLAGYVSFLGGNDPVEQAKFASYLLSASIMNAPAAIVMSKIMMPETEPEKIDTQLKVNPEKIGVNLVDALSNGAADGLKLALNVGGMLLAFIAIIYALNGFLVNIVGNWTGLNEFVKSSTNGHYDGFSLQYVLGQVFRLFAFAIGVDWSEALQVGSLIGQKTVINEFIAYSNLAALKAQGLLSNKAIIISTYALCGFSNFSSIAIQIGGIGGMAPSRQGDLSRLGMRALAAATLACLMTATIAGAIMG